MGWRHTSSVQRHRCLLTPSLRIPPQCSNKLDVSHIIAWKNVDQMRHLRRYLSWLCDVISVNTLIIRCNIISNEVLSYETYLLRYTVCGAILWRNYKQTSFHCATAPRGLGSPHCRGFTITLSNSTLGRTPLDEWSARHKCLYVTAHNTHKRIWRSYDRASW
jgi:hypothetical protein